jgi:transposase
VGEVEATDTLGRRSGPRVRRTVEDKRRIVEETLAEGSSVAIVARKYEVNANQVFAWRRLYQQGLLEVRDAAMTLAMMPVTVSDTPKYKKRGRPRKSVTPPSRRSSPEGSIEIEFSSGQRLRVQGAVDVVALGKIIDLLSSR